MNEQQAMLEKSMRSVFVGNIPFDLTEERLKEVFSEVGPVLSFKLVYDRENGKPKGYGFCEYKDIETANSAMRNLNGYEIGGRVLKVDNAGNEKTRMELQNAMAGPEAIPESPFEHIEPEKVPEAISKAVASLPPEQMFELMKQMKQCIQNNPHEARTMLLQNPQLAYGLLQSLVVMRIIDPEIALTMLSGPHNVPDFNNPEPRPVQPPPIRPEYLPQQPSMQMAQQHISQPQQQINDMDQRSRMVGGMPPLPAGPTGDVDLRTLAPPIHQHQQMPVPAPVMPPLPNNPPAQDQQMRDPRGSAVPGMPRDPRSMDPRSGVMMGPSQPPLPRQPPPGMQQQGGKPVTNQGKPPGLPVGMMAGMSPGNSVSDQEKAALIMQVLQLTDEQIAMLPAEQRQSILMLKEQIAKSSQR